MYTYHQSTGVLDHNGAPLLTGYAGHGAGVNNPAMQDQRDIPQAVRAGVFPDPAGGHVGGLLRHCAWLVTPGLICHFVHIAVIARQIAAAVHLDDELPKRGRAPALPQERGNVKARWPGQPRRVPHENDYDIKDSLRRSCGTSACFRKFLQSHQFHRYHCEVH